ncbi:hypothetical protein BRADI_3g15302v3, partial [Brachypodium distachyon]
DRERASPSTDPRGVRRRWRPSASGGGGVSRRRRCACGGAGEEAPAAGQSARALMQSGLRSCPESEDVWIKYLRKELTCVNKLKA